MTAWVAGIGRAAPVTSGRLGRSHRRMADPMGPHLVEIEAAAPTSAVDRHAIVTTAFETYHEELYSFLRRATGDLEAAEDLLQDTYLRLTREVEAGRSPDHIRGWLYRVASNLAISRGRRRTTALEWMRRDAHRFVAGLVESPESELLGRERTSAIDAVLAKLPAEARTAMLLSSDGFSGAEIAEAIGRSPGATRTLLSRARVRVRLELEQHGDVR